MAVCPSPFVIRYSILSWSGCREREYDIAYFLKRIAVESSAYPLIDDDVNCIE